MTHMSTTTEILKELKKCNFRVSTDTRKDVSGTIYFALKGDSFDGNNYIRSAIKNGAIFAVSDKPENKNEKVFIVDNVLKTLQEIAKEYRKLFKIPVIVIGGSNGKTTSKDLLVRVLDTKYKTHSTVGSLNNHLGVPLSILEMNKKTEIAVFEIGANHPMEHTDLLNIINPTFVVVTNNGMDHLEGFGSPQGVRKANKEIYDWAKLNKAKVFVNKKHKDLLKDSSGNKCIKYPTIDIKASNSSPIELSSGKIVFKTHLNGSYNLENIELAVCIGKYFKISKIKAFQAISKYIPSSKRSEFRTVNNIDFIVDCYNANPTSMKLSIQSFIKSTKGLKGMVIGDMLEMGIYSDAEHKKIIDLVKRQKIDSLIFIGKNFKKALKNFNLKYKWFPNSDLAKVWFKKQKFDGYTFLLKGSRGIKVEKILEL